MSLSIRIGNFLYNNAFALYKPLYGLFKKRQDAFEISLLHRYLKQGSVVVDIGANIGFYAKIISRIVGPFGKVYCFEPDEKNFMRLTSTTATLENVVLVNKAVGEKTEKLKIYLSMELNVDHRTYEPEEYERTEEIDAVSLDDFLTPGTHVDMIKMDIQGFEMSAIRGMTRTIADNPRIIILSELWPYGLRQAHSSVMEYVDFLHKIGMTIKLVEKEGLKELDNETVKSIAGLGKEHFYNIVATRTDV
jgi:FkbM family methyltransferase